MTPQLAIGILIATAVAAFSSGWAWNGARADARYSAMLAAQAQATAYEYTETTKRQKALNEAVRTANDELYATRTANDDLARRVAAGTGRLYVRAKCPSVPAADPATAGAAAGTAELDAAARPDYFAIRAGLAEQYAKLTKCRALALKLTGE